jgi:hypothetical protein
VGTGFPKENQIDQESRALPDSLEVECALVPQSRSSLAIAVSLITEIRGAGLNPHSVSRDLGLRWLLEESGHHQQGNRLDWWKMTHSRHSRIDGVGFSRKQLRRAVDKEQRCACN